MNRLWLRSFVLLFCAIQFVLVSKLGQAEDRVAEKMLPKDTLAFFTISSVPELVKKWDKTSLGQLCHDPQFKSVLDDVNKKKEEWSKDVEEEVGVSIDDLLKLPQGELSIAFIELATRKFAVVAMLEYGSNQETIDKFLKKVDENLEKQKKVHSTEEIENIKVHIYADKSSNAGDLFNSDTVTYFTDKSYLVLSNDVEAIKEVLNRWGVENEDTLAQNDQYKYIQTQCKIEGSEPLIRMFLNPIGLIQAAITAAQSAFPQAGMASGFLPLLGIDGLKGYGGAMTFDEGEFEGIFNSFVFVENPRGVIGVFNFPAMPLSPPKWVPAAVGSYSVLNWNVLGAYISIETLLDSFQGRGATARLMEQLADQGPQINPKKDLIDHLDGKIHFVQREPKDADSDAAPAALMFFGLGLKDPAKMKKTLAAAAKSDDSNMESREFNGETIYEMSQPDSDNTLSFAVTEGNLVITNDTPMLEGMIRGQTGRAAALVDSDEYKRFAKFFPSKTSMQGFQRADVQVKMGYNLLKGTEPDATLGIDFSKLPPFESIAKYLLPSASYVIPDKKGAKMVTFTLKRNE